MEFVLIVGGFCYFLVLPLTLGALLGSHALQWKVEQYDYLSGDVCLCIPLMLMNILCAASFIPSFAMGIIVCGFISAAETSGIYALLHLDPRRTIKAEFAARLQLDPAADQEWVDRAFRELSDKARESVQTFKELQELFTERDAYFEKQQRKREKKRRLDLLRE